MSQKGEPLFGLYFLNDRWPEFIKNVHRVTLGYYQQFAKYLRDQSKNVQALPNSKQHVKNAILVLAQKWPQSSCMTKRSQLFQAEILLRISSTGISPTT